MITPKLVDFLTENRWRNDREWFQAHKEQYREWVLDPLCRIVEDLTPFMRALDPHIECEPAVDRTISRIHRDVRFSMDKSLYRDEVWISFMRDKKQFPGYPQFFLYITPEKYSYGCGYFLASRDSMDSVRRAILERDPRFSAVLKDLRRQDRFHLTGEFYKKDRFPDEPEECKNWLNRKGLCLEWESRDFTGLYDANLAERLAEEFGKLKSFYRFLMYTEERKYQV